jgi:hypothetical protein
MTDEEIWAMWRESLDVHSMEVDMAFARKIEQAAIKAEREACAKVCDAMGGPGHSGYRGDADNEDCAAAIRARSQP